MAETMNLYVDSIRETDGVARVGVTLKTYRRHYFGIGGRIGFRDFATRIVGNVDFYDDSGALIKLYRNVDAALGYSDKPQSVADDTIDDLDRQMIYAFVAQLNRERTRWGNSLDYTRRSSKRSGYRY